jgi:hydroxypyruvate reductase
MMHRRELERVLRASLGRLDLEQAVRAALPRAACARARVIAIGKAAPAMARGALARWGDRIVETLVVTTDGTSTRGLPRGRVEVLRAGHPLPDARSVRAGERALATAGAGAHDGHLLVVLVSGGTSALACAPIEGVGLSVQRELARVMLASGATIQEINVVRKHVSRIKGGGLARAASPAEVLTLVASDVIGGEASDVGSGPSVGDRSSVADARHLLRRYAPRFADLPLARTGPADNTRQVRIVASPEALARAAAAELRARGARVRVLSPSQAQVEALAEEYVARARTLRTGEAVVRAAEPALEVARSRPGRGGRSTHLAALVGRSLPGGVLFAALASDGVDGSSGTAGAIVGGDFVERTGAAAVARALARFDTGTLHLDAGTALPARPTGQNLADLHVLVR